MSDGVWFWSWGAVSAVNGNHPIRDVFILSVCGRRMMGRAVLGL